MRELWNRIISKPTLFSVLGILLILLSIPTGIYSYLNSDPSTEGWVLTIYMFIYIGIGFIYAIDRILVERIKPRKLSMGELILTIILSIIIACPTSHLYVDIADSKENFVLVVENNGQLENSKLNSISFFEDRIKTTDNLIIVNKIAKIELDKKPEFWGFGHYYNKYSFDKYEKVLLYSNPNFNMNSQINESFIDSLIGIKK